MPRKQRHPSIHLRYWLRQNPSFPKLRLRRLGEHLNGLSRHEYQILLPNFRAYHRLMKITDLCMTETVYKFTEQGQVVFVIVCTSHLVEIGRKCSNKGTFEYSFEHCGKRWLWEDQVLIRIQWKEFKEVYRMIEKVRRQIFLD